MKMSRGGEACVVRRRGVRELGRAGVIVRRKEFSDALIGRLELKLGKAKALNLLDAIEKAQQAPPLAKQVTGRI